MIELRDNLRYIQTKARLDYKRNRTQIALARKKKRKQEKSSGVAKKRERMAAQGKTLGGDRIQKRVG